MHVNKRNYPTALQWITKPPFYFPKVSFYEILWLRSEKRLWFWGIPGNIRLTFNPNTNWYDYQCYLGMPIIGDSKMCFLTTKRAVATEYISHTSGAHNRTNLRPSISYWGITKINWNSTKGWLFSLKWPSSPRLLNHKTSKHIVVMMSDDCSGLTTTPPPVSNRRD